MPLSLEPDLATVKIYIQSIDTDYMLQVLNAKEAQDLNHGCPTTWKQVWIKIKINLWKIRHKGKDKKEPVYSHWEQAARKRPDQSAVLILLHHQAKSVDIIKGKMIRRKKTHSMPKIFTNCYVVDRLMKREKWRPNSKGHPQQ